MTGSNFLLILAAGFVAMVWTAEARAEGTVTIYAAPATAKPTTIAQVAPDGTPVIHKSLHRKRSKHASSATSVVATPSNTAPIVATTTASPSPHATQSPVAPVPPKSAPMASSAATYQVATGPILPGDAPTPAPAAVVPTVETGLPIAAHPTDESASAQPPAANNHGSSSYHTLVASIDPPISPVIPVTSMVAGTFSSASRSTTVDNITFTDYEPKHTRQYPWKRAIFTTQFWIGEGASSLSSTDNIGSAWDADWRNNSGGTDTPDDRSEYGPASHVSLVNTFYVALPFNDLVYPDKARRWLPAGWHRPPQDGKQVSACKDRWVEIKNAQGDTCYAQWEDVGPLRSDHAEYVFGDERPDTLTRAGLDVSPAVYTFLGLDGGRNRYTSWRFVDAEDVRPGPWLKYDEQAVLYKAIHELKDKGLPSSDEPIQRSIAPLDDPSNIDSNKKRVGAAKG